MEIKIYPSSTTNLEELEKGLDEIQEQMNVALAQARSNKVIECSWEKVGDVYILTLNYTGEGRVKNWVIKKVIKKAIRKLDKHVKIK